MNSGKFSIVVIIGLVLVAVGLSAFTVNEREQAIKLRLGEVVKADYAPGLHWKIPVIHTVRKFPKRILTISDRPERVFTAENEALEVDFRRLLEKQMDARLGPLIALGRQLRCLDVCASIALEFGQPVGISDPDYYAALAEQLDTLCPDEQAPAFTSELDRELGKLQQRWTGVTAGDELPEHITATAATIRGILNRIMEAGR